MTQKSLGQIAFEKAFDFADYADVWDNQGDGNQSHWERIAQAVAEAERERIFAWLRNYDCATACMDVAALALKNEYAKGVK